MRCIMISIIFGLLLASFGDLARGQNITSQQPGAPGGANIAPAPGQAAPPNRASPQSPPAKGAGTSDAAIARPFPYPPPQPQFCPGRKPGFLNDRCDDDHPCYNDYSLVCRDNKCTCNQNMIPSRENNGLCESAPFLNQPCDEQCQPPLVCKANTGDSPVASSATDTSGGSAASAPVSADAGQAAIIRPPPPPPPPPSPTGKFCRCAPPYVLRNGYECRLECKPEEWYDATDGKCKPRCKANEIKLENGDCAQISKIGENCKDDRQCIQPYARCVKGKCACGSGFDENGGQCTPKKYTCPWQEPVRDSNGNVLKCTKTNPIYPDYQTKDSCPNDSYCQTTETNSYYPNNVLPGFCCPRPKVSCPVGDPLPDTTCGPIYYPLEKASSRPPKPCPYETHSCHSVSVTNGYTESICCPKACRENFLLVKGKCYQPVQYGDACEVDEQCQSSNGVCSDGTCKCPPNAVAQGSDEYKYCSITCPPDEIFINNKCYKRLKLGDSCEGKPSNLCPDNAGCDEQNKCSCLCNFIQLGDNRCGPYPVCRKQYYYYPPYPGPIPLDAAAATDGAAKGSADGAGGKRPDRLPKTTQRPPVNRDNSTGAEDAAIAAESSKTQGYTFCRLYEDDTPPVRAVRRCPRGQYCNYYQPDFGLCCPIPDPICPNGAKGTKSCKPEDVKACGTGNYCYQYFQGQGGSSPHAGYTCCYDAGGIAYPVDAVA